MAGSGDQYKSEGGQHDTGLNDLLGYWLRFKGPSGFSSASTAEDVSRGWDGTGKVVLITGASTGIGLESARVLAMRGAECILGVRDMAKAQRNVDAIKRQQPDAKLILLPLDLSSLESVRQFAQQVERFGKPLHVLMLNAGIMAPPFSLSADGWELQFATNHLGHFLLAQLLMPKLVATAAAESAAAAAPGGAGSCRVVVTSSLSHFKARGLDLQTSMRDGEGYDPQAAYRRSKLCNILFARALAERLADKNVTVACCHPGVVNTELMRSADMSPALRTAATALLSAVLKSPAQGAATQVYCATSADIMSGEYYADSNLQPSHPLAHSRKLAEQLWDASEQMCAGTYNPKALNPNVAAS